MRVAIASTAVCLSIVGLCVAQDTKAAMRVSTNIPSQGLGPALQAFAQSRDLQVLYFSGVVKDLRTGGAVGDLTTDEALTKLLSGTGLTYQYVDLKAITVLPLVSGPGGSSREQGASPKASGKKSFWQRLRLAQATEPSSSEGEGQREDRRIESAALGSPQSLVELEEIVVTGTQIRGVENATVPVIVLERAYIDSTGAGTTAELIQSLPQNFALASQSGVLIPGVSGAGEQGAAINLRGIGEGTTLVLLNGRRMAPGFAGSAVDISALPLSAIERVEILTDGASAIYGSDAVGGVVNFILRDDFTGAETRARAGRAAGGLDEYRASQVLGGAWGSGNALISAEYYQRDLLPAGERDFVPATSVVGSLLPQDENVAVMFSGKQRLTDTLAVFSDALYTKRDTFNEGGRTTFHEDNNARNPQITATLGLTAEVGENWLVEASGSYSENKLDRTRRSDLFATPAFGGSSLYESRFESRAAQLKADGPVVDLPGGSVRIAAGVDWRSESFRSRSTYASGRNGIGVDSEQTVRSAFAEVYVPIIGADNALSWAHRLDVSLAGRFDDYSDFGSSFNPKIGLAWEPIYGLRLRGSYGTSYRAPRLADYDLSANGAVAVTLPDPGSATGSSQQLQVIGADVGGFSAQESENYSFGLELTPLSAPGLGLKLSYYRIDYQDQIVTPAGGTAAVILANPASFGSLIIRNPSVAQVNQYIALGQLGQGFVPLTPLFLPDPNFDPGTIDVIVDARRRNLSWTSTDGLDASVAYDFGVAGSDVHLGLDGVYVFKLEQQATSTSAPFDTVSTIFNPAQLRLRGSLGWRWQGWGANVFVNYMDSYADNRLAVSAPVSSWTTVDARLSYDFSPRFKDGILSGAAISASVQNLLDEDPPPTVIIDAARDMGFDPTNASPMGRLVAIEITKKW